MVIKVIARSQHLSLNQGNKLVQHKRLGSYKGLRSIAPLVQKMLLTSVSHALTAFFHLLIGTMIRRKLPSPPR